jgi:hypothetical protein
MIPILQQEQKVDHRALLTDASCNCRVNKLYWLGRPAGDHVGIHESDQTASHHIYM